MTTRIAHDPEALLAAGIGVSAAFAAGAAGPGAFALAGLVLVLGYGRGRGWRIARALDRPKLFAVLGGLYLPLFFLDMMISISVAPVGALVRLLVFLLGVEVLAGDPPRAHRPVLFGLLFMMAAAAETTEIWFVLPLAAFGVTAIAAQIRSTLRADQPVGAENAPPPPVRGALPIAAGSLALGAVFFFLVPRAGTGWGHRPGAGQGPSNLETGLSEEVNLGAIGAVKRRSSVAFRARLDRSGSGATVDPDSIYWRAQVYTRWTGSGWARHEEDGAIALALPANQEVRIPGAAPSGESLIAEIERVRAGPSTILSPGLPLWLRAARSAIVLASPDGSLRGGRADAPRLYTIAARIVRSPEGDRAAAVRLSSAAVRAGTGSRGAETGEAAVPAAGAGDDPFLTQTGDLDPEIVAWALSVAPEARDSGDLARAFVSDLASRRYSLDTRSIDPRHPIASFLAGAPAHCEYFASAMALGLRLRGVAARVVGGYLGADTVPFGRDLLIRDSRAHLWVEVRLPGAGWTLYDPTPPDGRFLSAGRWPMLRATWDRTVVLWDSWVIGLDLGDQIDVILTLRERLARSLRAFARALPRLACGALALAALAGLALIARRRRTRRLSLEGVPGFYRRLLALASRRGLSPSRSETAGEFARRAAGVIGDATALVSLTALYEKSRFGEERLTTDELTRAEAALARLTGL